MNNVTVYTRPDCIGCLYTKKILAKRGIAYIGIDITTDTDAAAHLQEIGVTELPYVVHGDESWTGFRIDKLRGINGH